MISRYSRPKNAAICSRVTTAPGEYVVADVPFVTPNTRKHSTSAAAYELSATSENEEPSLDPSQLPAAGDGVAGGPADDGPDPAAFTAETETV